MNEEDIIKISTKIIRYTVLASILMIGIVVPSASAFSGYGNGASAPYHITTCTQLQEMADDLAGSYELTNNIDCTGTDFLPIGSSDSPFTGTLNGNGYEIDNLSINVDSDRAGLIGYSSGATINDLALNNAIVYGNSDTGVLAGAFENSSATDIRANNNFVSGINEVGGLFGEVGGSGVENASSLNGDVIGGNMIGGLVGEEVGGASISDTYDQGGTVSGGNDLGGLIGEINAGPAELSNSYSGDQIIAEESENVGDLIGNYVASDGQMVSNSFAVGPLAGTSNSGTTGALIGNSQGATNDLWYDFGLTGSSNCVGSGSANCTSMDPQADGVYFSYSSNDPLEHWDFSNTWVQNTRAFPSLQPLFNWGSTDAPNNNDANGDGIDNSFKSDVNSVPNPEQHLEYYNCPD